MKLKLIMATVVSLIAVAAVACTEVVFPTPLPTATPAPTATPIVFPTPLPTATPVTLPSPVAAATPPVVVFPTPLPTATPFVIPTAVPTATALSVVFPTPLPTATPFVVPTAVPTATPLSVVFPTPLPTATPISLTINARFLNPPFATIDAVKVIPLQGDGSGTGFAFATSFKFCHANPCILTAAHVAGRGGGSHLVNTITNGSFQRGEFLGHSVRSDERNVVTRRGLDIAVVAVNRVSRVGDLTRFEFAVGDETVRVGEAVRVVALDIYERLGLGTVADQRVIDGIVSSINEPGIEFSITAQLLPGHSGGVVLNENMEVIGMVSDRFNVGGRAAAVRVVHVDAIRGKLCEWGYLVGSACR